jgi:hypothetical protein
VDIEDTGGEVPRLICSSGMLQEGSWDSRELALRLKIGLQPWSSKIPEGQDYYATIKHAGYRIKRIEGAQRVDLDDYQVSDGFQKRMDSRGFTVHFRPATPEQPQAGEFTVYFEKEG